MAWNTDVSADGKPHSLWKQGRALASQPESVTKTNIAENRIHRSGVNARRQKPLSTQSPSDLNKKHTHNRLTCPRKTITSAIPVTPARYLSATSSDRDQSEM
ncbi:hypothetical protein [Escherichia coli]|uniref:hypothetical protein n=1 Tax=Escherichia coli TaxID=562 RepID=UPI0020235FB1|nr:hypothetical protein [Escherichia coli]WCQ46254.1 hypothetical protein NL420_009535 [Escherichia coli]